MVLVLALHQNARQVTAVMAQLCLALPVRYFLCNLPAVTRIAQCQQWAFTAFKRHQYLII